MQFHKPSGVLTRVLMMTLALTAFQLRAAEPCAAKPYVEGAAVATGELVRNGDAAYQCDVGGWCSMAGAGWAYEPGVGMYWELAWHLVTTCGSENRPPSVALTAPADGEVFDAGNAVDFRVAAADSDGEVVQVDYYLDGVRVASLSQAPFSYRYDGLAVGPHRLHAVAFDNEGAEAEAEGIVFEVRDGGGDELSVRLTQPAPGARVLVGSRVVLAADVRAGDQAITRVDFLVDERVVASDRVAPYEVTWTAAGMGAHQLSARVTDAGGATAAAPAVSISVFEDRPGDTLGRVVVGYWETWDAVIHSAGHIPLNDIHDGYNVLNVAFPVLLPDGTAVLEDGMAPGEDPPSPAEIAQAQAEGRKVLLSIGGAAAGINLNSSAVVQRFIETIIPILERDGYDGIDIDIESGLVAGPSFQELSPSQSGLLTIILAVTDHFGPDFMLTMAPETAYVTGGAVAYGGPWGAYLPIIDRVRDRLDWIQMQYYNGSMYGRDGRSYPAGTVEGMVQQTIAMVEGFQVAGGATFAGLDAKQVVVGLPAITGAGNGYMRPSDVQAAFDQLDARYANLRGLMTWSANWDASNGYEYVGSHRPYLDNLGPIE